MADLETKLRWLSERGDPVGAEALIERIEAHLAGEPLVVVAKRREAKAKPRIAPTISRPSLYRGPALGVATFVAVVAVAGLYLTFGGGGGGEVADTPPPPTSVAPEVPPPTTVAPEVNETLAEGESFSVGDVVAGGADAFLLARGEGPGGPWSYWVWTAHCERLGRTVVYQWVEYAPLRGGISTGGERCAGGDSRVQPYVVEQMGVGDDGWSFIHGQTALDVVRVKVRLLDGREFEASTMPAPDELGWSARFYVMLLPVGFSEIDTVRGYDASGQDIGGDSDPGEGASG